MQAPSIFLPVDQAYDRWSSIYDNYDNPMVYMATEIIARRSHEMLGAQVFEFGCGTGRNLAALLSAGAREVGGCDLSHGMLKVARERLPEAVLFRHDMNAPTSLTASSVDVALFCLTLEHVEKLTPALSEAKRIVKAEGRIVIVEIHPFYSMDGAAAHFDDETTEVRMPTYAHQFADYLKAFAELGLQIHACREWRPIDIGSPKRLHGLKRGEKWPLTVEFELVNHE